MNKIVVKITETDIFEGRRDDSEACPIALSLKRLFPEDVVCVESWQICINGVAHPTSSFVNDWIDAFDDGCDMEPFTFEL